MHSNNSENVAAYAVERLTLRARLTRRLFPSFHLAPSEPAEGYAEGDLMTDTEVRLDWADRIRLLISGRFMLQTRTQCNVMVSKSRARSIFYVLPPGGRR